MSGTNVFSRLSVALAICALASSAPVYGQSSGIPEDWSHHHQIFSNPGTLWDALLRGDLEKWLKITGDTRYQLRQAELSLWERLASGKLGETKTLKKDWSMDLGTGATVGAGQYPAKYNFSTTSETCSDYVAYNTGVAGNASTQANIVAYSNLYDTTCATPNPSVAWAYYTGTGSALTSPVLSVDGTKIAFVENTTSGAILRILKWKAGEGTASAPKTPTNSYTNTTVGTGGNTAWSACPTGQSCLFSVAFYGGHQDTISAPFYVYDGSDVLYVGDASGYLHKFTGVFNGTPADTNYSPASAHFPSGMGTNALTSPVYDSGGSGNVFVADTGGFLYGANYATGTKAMTSSKLIATGNTTGIIDAPIVDSTTEKVYVFVGDDANTSTTGGSGAFTCENSTGCSGVFQFAATNTTTGQNTCTATSATSWGNGNNCGTEALFGAGAYPQFYDGAFDHLYETGTGTTGNIWVCSPHADSEPRLASVALQSNGGIVPANDVISFSTVTTAILALTSAAATCSPVTEIYGSAGSTDDYIYLSVTASGSLTTTNTGDACTGACLYNFIVSTNGTSTVTPTTAYAGIATTAGSSGIIVDNTGTATGESQIYYTPLGNQTCAGNGTTGSGTGGCAVQTSQTAP